MIGGYTAERVSANNQFDNYLIQRHLFAYNYAAQRVTGTVLEIGCGEGYGYSVLKERVDHYVGVDKIDVNSTAWTSRNADFFRMKVPLLRNIPSNIFDFVIAFQVIEHIEDDQFFAEEISRVLKKGGKLLLSTPNKKASFTRNPWHIREYEAADLTARLRSCFSNTQVYGLNGSENLKKYLVQHKSQVDKILKWDLLQLEKRLPRQMLKVPYNLFNYLNKILVYKKNGNLVNNIFPDDFILGESKEDSLDLFVVAVK
ncbi:MAG: class I SAM-dependent methyltransferase [Chitinophagaceae bacterium]